MDMDQTTIMVLPDSFSQKDVAAELNTDTESESEFDR